MSKKSYLVLARSETGKNPESGPSPEQMQKMFAAYKAWMEKFQDDIVDKGDKLTPEGRVVSASGVADGPFVEAKELIAGYMIIAADDFDGAVEIVRAMPGSGMPGVRFEIRELSGAKM